MEQHNRTARLLTTFEQYKFVVEVYIVGTLCALGIASNVLCIVVLGRDKSIRRTTGLLLQMLAVADTGFLVTCLFYQTLNAVDELTNWLPDQIKRSWPYVEQFAWPCASVAQTATVWLVVVVTADRYVAICWPLHATQYSTVSRVRITVIVVWIVAAVYNLPRFFERDVVALVGSTQSPLNFTTTESTTSLSSFDSTNYQQSSAVVTSSFPVRSAGGPVNIAVRKTGFRENAVYVLVYKTCLFFVVRFFIPFTSLAFFNQRLIRAIRESNRITTKTRHSGDGSHKEQRHTLTLVVVVVVFVLCELPDLVLRAWLALHQYLPSYVAFPRSILLYVNVASNLCLTVNSCVNFVIYFLMGHRFRSILLRMLCSRCYTRRRHRAADWPGVGAGNQTALTVAAAAAAGTRPRPAQCRHVPLRIRCSHRTHTQAASFDIR